MAYRQRMSATLQAALRNLYLWRNLIALAGMASMMLPWVYLDGAESSLRGAELVAYTFVTGSERWKMLQESIPGALSVFLVPPAVAVLSILVFTKTWRDQHDIKLNAFAGILPALIVLFSGSITSSEHSIAGRLIFPQAGIIVMFLCQGVLAAYSSKK